MEILFIHSLLSHDYSAFANKMLIEVIFWVLVFCAMVADLVAGVHKAKQRDEARLSEGFKRSISKFVLYFSALMIALIIDFILEYVIISFSTFIPAIPYATILISLYLIIFVEGKSILEKAGDKHKKQLSKDIIGTIAFLESIKDKDILEYISKLVKDKENETEQ